MCNLEEAWESGGDSGGGKKASRGLMRRADYVLNSKSRRKMDSEWCDQVKTRVYYTPT